MTLEATTALRRSLRPLTVLASCLALFSPPLLRAQEETSTLTVLKLVSPVSDGTVFPFTLDGSGTEESFDLAAGESETFALEPGTYVVRESVPENWELVLIRCGIFYEVGPVASGALEIELEPGDSETCLFTNNLVGVPPPHPPPGPVGAPALSPTAVSLLMMALAAAGAVLLRKAI